MSVDYSDKKYRSDFDAERKRLLAAIKSCNELDVKLTTLCDDLRANMTKTRGAGSLLARFTEQQISNRNQHITLIKELRNLRKDVIDREIKLAAQEVAANAADKAATQGRGNGAISPELLASLQAIILVPGAAASILEPADVPDDGHQQTVEQAQAGETGNDGDTGAIKVPNSLPPEGDMSYYDDMELSGEIAVGDIVSDREGTLWAIAESGEAEPVGATALRVVVDTGRDDVLPHAFLESGRIVLVVDFE